MRVGVWVAGAAAAMMVLSSAPSFAATSGAGVLRASETHIPVAKAMRAGVSMKRKNDVLAGAALALVAVGTAGAVAGVAVAVSNSSSN